jgi:hypothetical protein
MTTTTATKTNPEDLAAIRMKAQTMIDLLQIIADTADKVGKTVKAWRARKAIFNLREGVARAEAEDYDTAALYFDEARRYMETMGQGARA